MVATTHHDVIVPTLVIAPKIDCANPTVLGGEGLHEVIAEMNTPIVRTPNLLGGGAGFVNAVLLLIDMQIRNSTNITAHALISSTSIFRLPKIKTTDQNVVSVQLRSDDGGVVMNLGVGSVICGEVHQVGMCIDVVGRAN